MPRLLLLAMSLLDPRGRCNRKGLLIIASAMLGVELILLGAFWGFSLSLTGPAASALKLLFCWLAITACSKRLHDLGRSAWNLAWALPVTIFWTLATALAFAFGLGLESLMPRSPWYPLAIGASMLPVVAATLWLHLARGNPGSNRFGPEPEGLGFSGPMPRRPADASTAAPAPQAA